MATKSWHCSEKWTGLVPGDGKTLEWNTSAPWLRALGFLLRDIKKPPTISKQIIRHFPGPLKSKHSEKVLWCLLLLWGPAISMPGWVSYASGLENFLPPEEFKRLCVSNIYSQMFKEPWLICRKYYYWYWQDTYPFKEFGTFGFFLGGSGPLARVFAVWEFQQLKMLPKGIRGGLEDRNIWKHNEKFMCSLSVYHNSQMGLPLFWFLLRSQGGFASQMMKKMKGHKISW